ncbi:MAG: MATE family efflux transporter [Candidatus Ventricola sp.]
MFETWPVARSVQYLAWPAIAGQLITVVYSAADTFFVGQIGDEVQLAAVSVSGTALLLLNTIANLFGVGGSSLLSRCLGAGKQATARKASAFSLWGSMICALGYSLLMLAFPAQLARCFGATHASLRATQNYLFFTVALGALPTTLTMVLSQLLRAEGRVREASLGLILSSSCNILLDPLMIYPRGLNMGVAGAAMATALSNCLSVAFYLTVLYRSRLSTVISFRPSDFRPERAMAVEILSIGFPQALKTTMSTVSHALMNHLAAPAGDYAVAAIGVAQKLDMMIMQIATGFSSGVMPMIGYNYAAKRYKRMRETLIMTLKCALSVVIPAMMVYFVFSRQLVGMFVTESDTAALGARFLKIICWALPGMTVSFILTALFQATGHAKEALILSFCRKGALDIPLLFLMNAMLPLWGLVLVQPITDTTTMILAMVFYRRFCRRLAVQR